MASDPSCPPDRDHDASAPTGAERREYFRVEDRAQLRYCIIDPAAFETTAAESYFEDSELFWLMRELRNIERENHNLLRPIAEQSRELAQYLRGLNRKIELLAGALAARAPHNSEPIEISLSENGLSLLLEPPLAVATALALELTLLPDQIGIVCFAQVIANRDEAPQRTVLRFVHLPEADRQLIARHLFQVQLTGRRQRGLAENP